MAAPAVEPETTGGRVGCAARPDPQPPAPAPAGSLGERQAPAAPVRPLMHSAAATRAGCLGKLCGKGWENVWKRLGNWVEN